MKYNEDIEIAEEKDIVGEDIPSQVSGELDFQVHRKLMNNDNLTTVMSNMYKSQNSDCLTPLES